MRKQAFPSSSAPCADVCFTVHKIQTVKHRVKQSGQQGSVHADCVEVLVSVSGGGALSSSSHTGGSHSLGDKERPHKEEAVGSSRTVVSGTKVRFCQCGASRGSCRRAGSTVCVIPSERWSLSLFQLNSKEQKSVRQGMGSRSFPGSARAGGSAWSQP